jgi:hypothetical protein
MTTPSAAHSPVGASNVQQLFLSGVWRPAAVRGVVLAAAVVGLLAGGQAAQASSLVWSVGVNTPGAVVQVGSHPPPRVVYQPAPVQVVVNPGWIEPVYRSVPTERWYAPHPGASLGHHRHWEDRHRGRHPHHHGWRDRDGDWGHGR